MRELPDHYTELPGHAIADILIRTEDLRCKVLSEYAEVDGMSDNAPFYGWLIKGLGGIINLLERFTQEKQKIQGDHFNALFQLNIRLQIIVEKQQEIK